MISNFLKFLAGVSLALGLLALGGITVARYLVEEFTASPPKPIFAEELPAPSTTATVDPDTSGEVTIVASATPTATPTPTPTPSPTPKGKRAKVTWPEGLQLRSEPSGAAIGGLEYNQEVTILETSSDGDWQKIWSNGQEGWIKAGNVDYLPETSPQVTPSPSPSSVN